MLVQSTGLPNIYVVGHAARGMRYLTSGLGFLVFMIKTVVGCVAQRHPS